MDELEESIDSIKNGVLPDAESIRKTLLDLHQRLESAEAFGTELEPKIADMAEGCAKMDADLSLALDDMREQQKIRQNDLKEFNERITEIADAQEKARRKSGLRNSPAAFESLRAVAESNSVNRTNPEHEKLVALAEG